MTETTIATTVKTIINYNFNAVSESGDNVDATDKLDGIKLCKRCCRCQLVCLAPMKSDIFKFKASRQNHINNCRYVAHPFQGPLTKLHKMIYSVLAWPSVACLV